MKKGQISQCMQRIKGCILPLSSSYLFPYNAGSLFGHCPAYDTFSEERVAVICPSEASCL